MSYRISLCTGLIGLSTTIALVQPNIAATKSAVEIGAIAKSITVQIVGENNSGSGVILQRQGDIYTVLTVAHAVDNSTNYKIVTLDDRSYQIVPNSIRIASGGIDLAVVKFKSTTKYAVAKLGNCNTLKSGMDLYLAGFPNNSRVITEPVLVFKEGKVSHNSSKIFDRRGYSLVYSNDTAEGMSGGGVLNGEGELVAIHGMGDRVRADDSNFSEKTGFNLGIPINRFAMVASKMGVELSGKVAPIPQNTALKADDYLVSGVQKYRLDDFREALADFDQAITLDPKSAKAHDYRGRLKSDKLNDVQGALADFNRAIALDPKSASAYTQRGKLKSEKLNDLQGALADYNQAIALDPKDTRAYYNRGNLKYSRLNDTQGALADCNRAISLNPKSAYAYTIRGGIKYYKLNDLQGALADYNQAIALDPKDTRAYYNRGSLKSEKLEDLQGALADYNQAIALSPKFTLAYHNRALLKEKLNDGRGALADWNQLIALDPKNAEAYFNRALLKAIEPIRDFQGVLADYNQAIALDPKNAEFYHMRAVLKDRLNDFQGALTDYDRAIALNPKNVISYTSRGALKKYKLNDEQGALADFQQAEAISRQQGLKAK
jgi:tetratricopeptide (TPR) repeat protein/V8-like Glu-specific endopeptidase